MTQPPQSSQPASPLTARMYDLEYPRSLGVYSTYQEVQSVVDTLADHEFPVQSTLIVGTDLKLMERVTGRKTWPKVISQGALSGLWMGLFLGLLLWLLNPGDMLIVLPAVIMGMVFFTVWQVIGYAMSGGQRDFTSMTSTIPMQYELLVEHKHAAQARQILAESGAAPAPVAPPAGEQGGAPVGAPGGAPVGAPGGTPVGAPGAAPEQAGPGQPQPGGNRPSFGRPASGSYGQPAAGASGASAPGQYGQSTPGSYGQSASAPASTGQQSTAGPSRYGRPSFGRSADEQSAATPSTPRPYGSDQPGEGGPGTQQQDPQAQGAPTHDAQPRDPQAQGAPTQDEQAQTPSPPDEQGTQR